MTKPSKGIALTIILFIATTIFTSWAIYHNYHNTISNDGEFAHNKWPYIKMAIQLSLLTFFAGTAMGLFKKVGILENIENDSTKTATLTILFCLGIGILCHLLYYPGLNQLGLDSDSHVSSTVSAISIIQTIYFFLRMRETLKEKVSLSTYILLIFVDIVIVFVSPFLPAEGNRFWE